VARAKARRVFMFMIRADTGPPLRLQLSAGIAMLGRVPCHCLSVLEVIAGLIGRRVSLVDTQRRLPCRHRYQSLT
jgi:hypothetical protein